MNKEAYLKLREDAINENFDKLIEYQEFNSTIFCGLRGLMLENHTCLMFNCYIASITLSNHILERLLKLTLIYHKGLHTDKATSISAYNQYQGKPLGKILEACKNLKIIDQKEYNHLKSIINEILRNGFSHSEFEKVLGNVPFTSKAYQGSFTNAEVKLVEVDRRQFISITQFMMHDFAKENAFEYFKYLWYLAFELERRLKPVSEEIV